MSANPLRSINGIHWKYNCTDKHGNPVKDFGRVFYADDGFGNLIVVTNRNFLHYYEG